MEKLIKCLLLLAMFSLASCGEAPTSGPTGIDPDDPTSEQPTIPNTTEPSPVVVQPNCQIAGKRLDENLFWAKSENLLLAVVADKETEDPDLGESHRILEVYDGKTCERISRNVLPVNVSPDFPYYLSDITYNKVSQVVAVRGFDQIYIYDLVKKQLSQPISPKYLSERHSEDAQTGMIQRLELWEDYLVGHADGKGAFVFDLSQPMEAKPVLPSAEFPVEKGVSYNSMFFLKSQENGFQAILPNYSPDSGELDVHPLFDNPLNIETNLNRSFRNNQFIVLKELTGGTTGKPIGIDMKSMKKIEIPAELAAKKDTEIIAWLKKQ